MLALKILIYSSKLRFLGLRKPCTPSFYSFPNKKQLGGFTATQFYCV